MVAAAKKDAKTTDGPTFRQRLDTAWASLLGALRKDAKGWVHLAVAAVVTLVLSAALYWPLGLPGRLLTRVLTKAVDGSCVTNTTGITNWFCGMGISLVAMSGAILVIIALILLRGQVRKAGTSAVKQGPAEFHFLEKPVVVTLAFAMAWSSVLFHFYGRMGLIIDGLFPAFVGLLMFSLDHWDGPIKKGLGPIWGVRERIPKPARLALVIAVPTLLGFLMTGWMPFGVRDQLAALIAVFIGWVMWTTAPEQATGAPPRRARATGAALVVLVTLAALLLIAAPVSAQGPCSDIDLYFSFVLCETAHHSGTFGAASSWVGIGATAVVLAPTKPEEAVVAAPDKKPEKVDVDPCLDQQSTFDQVNTQSQQNADALRLMDQLIEDREAAYERLSQSTLISQSVDLAAAAWSLGSRVAGVGAKTVAGKLGQMAAETITPAIIKEALNEAMVKGNRLEAIKTAMQVAGQLKDKGEVFAVQKALESSILDQEAQRLVALGFEEGGYVFKNAMKEYAKTAQTLAAPVADFAGLAGQGLGLLSMYWDYENMDTFMQRIAHMRKRRVDLWEKSLYLGDQLAEAKHQLDGCRYRVAHGLEVG